jgi:hypothetical protein
MKITEATKEGKRNSKGEREGNRKEKKQITTSKVSAIISITFGLSFRSWSLGLRGVLYILTILIEVRLCISASDVLADIFQS